MKAKNPFTHICFFQSHYFLKPKTKKTGSVVFIHPDGTALADWNALRIITVGPDSEINWDKLSGIGLYQGHIKTESLLHQMQAQQFMHTE